MAVTAGVRPARARPWLAVLAWALFGLAVLGFLGLVWLDHLLRRAGMADIAPLSADAVVYVLGAVSASATGAVLASRRPRHPVGWLLLGLSLFIVASGALSAYAKYGLLAGGMLPGAAYAAVYDTFALVPIAACLGFILLLTPTGALPSPRWRWWAWSSVAAPAIAVASAAMLPLERQYASIRNPLAVPPLVGPLRNVGVASFAVTLLATPVAAVSLVRRFRRARGAERQQLWWVAFAATLTGVVVLVIAALGVLRILAPLDWLLGVWVTLLPVAICAAVLRYRLYDLDQLITRTLVYGLLTAAFTAVYLVIVVGIGTVVGRQGKPSLFLSIAATGLIAVAFQPAREHSRRLANRLVYGRRATPYEVLSEFSHTMAGASTDVSLPRMARLVVEATGAVEATVWLRLGEVLQPQARWPQAEPMPEPVALQGRGVHETLAAAHPASRSFPVGHDDELLGALTVTVSPAEPLTGGGERLIADLAAQTGLGLRFARLKERALFARALASFLPAEVAELVEASPSALSLREELEATIVFSDIRGFSSLAERLPPRQVAEVVGRHLTAMVDVVTTHGGVLDKFAGDAVMAVFGAPRPVADHARRAVACAAAMQRRQTDLDDDLHRAGLPTFQIGVGVNTGTVIAGTLGGSGRLDYTVLGDAVNVAQRLQSEAAGGEILASAATVRKAQTDRAEPVGLKRLKGREELVETYRIRWADLPGAGTPSMGSSLA